MQLWNGTEEVTEAQNMHIYEFIIKLDGNWVWRCVAPIEIHYKEEGDYSFMF